MTNPPEVHITTTNGGDSVAFFIGGTPTGVTLQNNPNHPYTYTVEWERIRSLTFTLRH